MIWVKYGGKENKMWYRISLNGIELQTKNFKIVFNAIKFSLKKTLKSTTKKKVQ